MDENKTSTMGGNPDIKFPPKTGIAIPYSENGKITGWGSAPSSGNYIITIANGKLNFLPIPQGQNVVTAVGGNISFVGAPSGGLSLFNNGLGWTGTQGC